MPETTQKPRTTLPTAATATAAESSKPVADRILLVDDDKIILSSLGEFLRLEGYTVDTADSVAAAAAALGQRPYALLLTDINMPKSTGFELLQLVRQRFAETVCIVITGYGTIESAVEAIKLGAYDYLTKPIDDDDLRLVVQRAMQQQALLRENRSLKQQLGMRFSLDNIVGNDYRMLKVFDLIETVADTRTTVLISGESGTGKSLIARTIHHRSARRDRPFIEVSCGAIPESLLESELFGHVKGAFTGAVGDKVGKFKAADGGTIFLDEISSASPALQVKLLRVLQEKQFEAVGSNTTETVDARVILATNLDLKREVEAGRFRQDLFYRINVVTIHLPPLVERLGDIPRLSEFFLRKICAEVNKDVHGISAEAIQALQRYHWPGNVRELENAIERAVVLTKSREIMPEDLPSNVLDDMAPPSRGDAPWTPQPLKQALEGPEKRILEAALKANNWNRQLTAQVLEINRTTLYKKMKRYGLEFEPGGAAR
ncbi:MAG: sigma-54 dependent transcriptional regulator [Phycisphaerae bacterium]|nr:sigma-54 dependent transcriptional regulator [Phycisphaerae bacterium]